MSVPVPGTWGQGGALPRGRCGGGEQGEFEGGSTGTVVNKEGSKEVWNGRSEAQRGLVEQMMTLKIYFFT